MNCTLLLQFGCHNDCLSLAHSHLLHIDFKASHWTIYDVLTSDLWRVAHSKTSWRSLANSSVKTETSVAATRSKLYTSIRKDLSQSTGTPMSIGLLCGRKGERERVISEHKLGCLGQRRKKGKQDEKYKEREEVSIFYTKIKNLEKRDRIKGNIDITQKPSRRPAPQPRQRKPGFQNGTHCESICFSRLTVEHI